MRTTFWASLLLAAAGPLWADAGSELPRVDAEMAAPGRTRLVVRPAVGPARNVVVARDRDVPAGARADAVAVLGAVGGTVLVVVETYPSRLNGGGGACGAGEERFLRVLRLQPPPAKATYSRKLASCWKELTLDPEAPDGGLSWSAAAGELLIQWFSGPDGGGPQKLLLRVGSDGRVLEVKPA